jgi:hypothetical protein
MAELTQGAADEMSAETRFHADDTWREFLECFKKRKPLDLAAESDLAISTEAYDVENFLADINAD